MRKMLWVIVFLTLLFSCAAAEEIPYLEAEVAEEVFFLTLPAEDAEPVLADPLESGERVNVTALGSSYCEAVVQGHEGYLPLEALDFAICEGNETQLGMIDKIETKGHIWGRVTLRTEPHRKAEAVKKLRKGEFVLKMEEDGEFIRVVGPGYEGYVLKKYVADAQRREYVLARVVNDDEIHMRMDTGYWDEWVILKLQPGEVVQLISDVRGWAYLEAHGYRGRTHTKYLKEIE